MTTTPRAIVVATDFSPTAEHAQRVAHRLAAAFGAELHLLHVRVLLEDPHLGEEQRHEFERMLSDSDASTRDALVAAGAIASDVRTIPHLVRGLSESEAIVETARDLGADLIIMGTHGRRGLSHVLLGSVAERVVRSSPIPVLTVRHDAVDLESVGRILVPHDFSSHSVGAVRLAGEWADALGSSITLFHAVEPVVYPDFYAVDVLPGELSERLQRRSREALEEAASTLLAGRSCDVRVVAGRAGETIVETAVPTDFDLVILGTRGLSGLEHLLLGSVAEGVIRRCAIPVLSVRAQ
jgi:nucleotide-binding universal stress UspA family protein